MENKLKSLKKYFSENPNIILAFLFGSRSKDLARKISDWDIAVYFKPKQYLELETELEYPDESKIWSDIVDILEAEVDLLVMNRARPSLVFSILNKGISLSIKDQKLYLKLLIKTSYEAIDFWNFVSDYWKIRTKAKSLSPEDKSILIEHLTFLEDEFKDLNKLEKLTWEEYRKDSFKRRNIEKLVENLVMSSLDIAKIILASDKQEIPQTYKNILKVFGITYFNSEFAEKFSQFAELRNMLVYTYLDIKWNKIKNFIREAKKLYPEFIKKIKEVLLSDIEPNNS